MQLSKPHDPPPKKKKNKQKKQNKKTKKKNKKKTVNDAIGADTDNKPKDSVFYRDLDTCIWQMWLTVLS